MTSLKVVTHATFEILPATMPYNVSISSVGEETCPALTLTLIDHASKSTAIDTSRIYSVGIKNTSFQ